MRDSAKELKGSYILRGCFSRWGSDGVRGAGREFAANLGRKAEQLVFVPLPTNSVYLNSHSVVTTEASEVNTFGLYLLEQTVGATQSRTLEEYIHNGSISNVLLGTGETHLED